MKVRYSRFGFVDEEYINFPSRFSYIFHRLEKWELPKELHFKIYIVDDWYDKGCKKLANNSSALFQVKLKHIGRELWSEFIEKIIERHSIEEIIQELIKIRTSMSDKEKYRNIDISLNKSEIRNMEEYLYEADLELPFAHGFTVEKVYELLVNNYLSAAINERSRTKINNIIK